MRGFLKNRAELETHLRLLGFPVLVGLQETLLDRSTEAASLTGYELVSRRDRRGGRSGGGVALFVRKDCAAQVALLEHSETHERSWHCLHTSQGPVLLGLWYRPPDSEVYSVETLETEWLRHSQAMMGTVVMGDCNVHHQRWLKYSSSTTPEGRALYDFCCYYDFEQRVKKPTRGANLLDLVLTDLHGCVTCKVHPKLADHSLVEATLELQVPTTAEVERECWNFAKADWKGLNELFASTNWVTFFDTADVDVLTERFTEYVLSAARSYIPVRMQKLKKSTHPWLNERCEELVRAKRAAEGTEESAAKLEACSKGMLEEFQKYTARVRDKLKTLPRSSKQWWKLK